MASATLAILLLSLLPSPSLHSQELKVASFNIRYENSGDYSRGNGWDDRYPWICSLIRYERPDLLGCQEVLKDQLSDMAASLPGYAYVGVGRDDGKSAGEHEVVLWRTDRFDLQDKGWFWLSETPDRPGLGWDAACVRICTYVKLLDKVSSKNVWMFNLHMDHVGVVARREGAKLVVSKIRELVLPGQMVFLCGDFNVDQDNEIYTIFTTSGILEDSYETAADRYAPTGTANTFDPNSFTKSRIDHIFVSPGTVVENYAVLTETYRGSVTLRSHTPQSGNAVPVQGQEGTFKSDNFPKEVSFERNIAKTPSDHFPVFIRVKL